MLPASLAGYLRDPDPKEVPTPNKFVATAVEELAKCFDEGRRPSELPDQSVLDAWLLTAMRTNNPIIVRKCCLVIAGALNEEVERLTLEDRVQLLKELIPSIEIHNHALRVHFLEYVEVSGAVAAKDSLRYRPVAAGMVTITVDHLQHLVNYHVLKRLGQNKGTRAPVWVDDHLKIAKKTLTTAHGRIKKATTIERKNGIKPEHFPPCINSWVNRLENGNHISHHERMNLIAFLHYFGMGQEQMVNLFRKLPGFLEGKTRYQIQHICETEFPDREEPGYLTMGCAQIRDLGICPDMSCKGKTPIGDYVYRIKAAKRRKARARTSDVSPKFQKAVETMEDN